MADGAGIVGSRTQSYAAKPIAASQCGFRGSRKVYPSVPVASAQQLGVS